MCVDDPLDDYDPKVEPSDCVPGKFYNRSLGYVHFVNSQLVLQNFTTARKSVNIILTY